jgi:Uma2 family endonuclease
MTATEYLVWERDQRDRHEFLRGEVFAMAGGSPRHNALIAAVTVELGVALRGGPCRVLSSDQRIAARDGEHYVYADATIVCGRVELATGTTDVLSNPAVVVEVLSKSTETYDRGRKWDGYRRLLSVTDYLLVAQSAPRVEHYRRDANGEWHYRVVEAGGRLVLTNGVVLDIDTVYAGAFDIEGE